MQWDFEKSFWSVLYSHNDEEDNEIELKDLSDV